MKFLWVTVITLLPGLAGATTQKMLLSAAIKDKSVTMDAVNTAGGYQGKTTTLTIKNNTHSPIRVTVDIGTLLAPGDSTYQPMLLAGAETLDVMPGAEGQLAVETFCGNCPRRCPGGGLHYSYSRVANDTLVKILRFVNANGLFDDLGQNAVWAVVNGRQLESVYDPYRDSLSKKLVDLICACTGRAKPDYHSFVPIVQVPDAPAYVPKTLKIFAEFEIILDAPKTMTLGVFDSAGHMIQSVFGNQEFGISGHRFNVEFESGDVPAGNYYLRLKEGDLVLQEKKVKVE